MVRHLVNVLKAVNCTYHMGELYLNKAIYKKKQKKETLFFGYQIGNFFLQTMLISCLGKSTGNWY